MSSLELVITPALAGQRLDRALSAAAPELSRAALQKCILAGRCLVDGLPLTRPDAKTRLGQRVAVQLPEAESILKPEEGDLELLYQDAHLAVCNKPAGLTVHPCPSCPEHTLVQRLLTRFPQLGKLGGLRPGIVHRLDKDTSGLLLVALAEPVRLSLSAAFAQREIRKEYLALVSGLAPAQGQCLEPLGRHPTAKVKMAVLPEARGGKAAHTQWRRLWHTQDQRVSLLAVRIHTGRTHQIRVHLAHVGHPLLGDQLYAPKDVRGKAPRQMLHAWKLGFCHPVSGQEHNFICPPPQDFLATALTAAHRMQRLVVTGNPGSGKSSLCRQWAQEGIPVISADAVVADLYRPDGEAALWLARRKPALLSPGGAVDKVALLAQMRADAPFRREWEDLVHALARLSIDAFWQKQEASGASLAVAEVPLYFEAGWHASPEPAPLTLCVHCPHAQRLARIMSQRAWSAEKAAALEAWQWPEARKEAACDVVLNNSGAPAHLKQAADDVLHSLQKRRTEQEETLRAALSDLFGASCSPRATGHCTTFKGNRP